MPTILMVILSNLIAASSLVHRSLYGRLKRKMPKGSRLNVKQRVERRIAEYSAQMLPDFAASIGVEAAAGRQLSFTAVLVRDESSNSTVQMPPY